jgi:hypothetical protein
LREVIQMRRYPDPLALDPLGPMDIGSRLDHDALSGPLALDPLSPIDWVTGGIGADGRDPEDTGE